ncbi:prepilin-type N-terminal cleavage/methylation domain-containing protein [bacterium]|nr:prepilin-type N-terminal cleavage/methylation domain-containing protein [bacterium]
MRLSNTMIMNESLLPSNKKAFTLAEVLITLSILGVVAALTIPSLVNRQNELAAITKLKKAISTYESVVEVYMAEEEATNFAGAADGGCTELQQYFKMTQNNNAAANATCIFTTADGALWAISKEGNAIVYDSARSPRYGVVMWTAGGLANSEQTTGINGTTVPKASEIPSAITPTTGSALAPTANPTHGFYKAADMLNITKSQNQNAANDHKDVTTPTATGVGVTWTT